MNRNKITRNMNLEAGEAESPGRTYGRDWGTYQATGGYRPSGHCYNPTPSDAAQNKHFERSIGRFGEAVRNPGKIDVRKGEQRR